MPTIMLIQKLAFIIHTRDEHNPPHIEVYYGTPESHEAWAKVRIDRVEIMEAFGFSSNDLNSIVKICQIRQKFLSSKWRKINGKRLQK